MRAFDIRRARAALTALAVAGVMAAGLGPAAAWTKGQQARQTRYLACKAELQKSPPCNDNWTRQCAKRCGARYI